MLYFASEWLLDNSPAVVDQLRSASTSWIEEETCGAIGGTFDPTPAPVQGKYKHGETRLTIAATPFDRDEVVASAALTLSSRERDGLPAMTRRFELGWHKPATGNVRMTLFAYAETAETAQTPPWYDSRLTPLIATHLAEEKGLLSRLCEMPTGMLDVHPQMLHREFMRPCERPRMLIYPLNSVAEADPLPPKDSEKAMLLVNILRAACATGRIWRTPANHMLGKLGPSMQKVCKRDAADLFQIESPKAKPKRYSRDWIAEVQTKHPKLHKYEILAGEFMRRNAPDLLTRKIGDDEVKAVLFSERFAALKDSLELSETFDKILKENEARMTSLTAQLEVANRRIAEGEGERANLADELDEANAKIAILEHRLASRAAAMTSQAIALAPNTLEGMASWAESAWPGRIEFTSNAVGTLAKSPFRKVGQVADILRVLATDFHDGFTGKIRMGVAIAAMSEAKAEYTANQSEMTMSRFDGYHRTHKGVTYECRKHICVGNSHDPQHAFRLYFDWDERRKVIVVLHAGNHLKNTKT